MDDNGWDRIAFCDAGISVGSRWSCDQRGDMFDRRIHIQYPGLACTCKNQKPGDLFLELVENQPLGFEVLDRIAEFVKEPGSVYVHCKAGMCRGPVVAVAAMLVRRPVLVDKYHAYPKETFEIGRYMGITADAMLRSYKWFPILPAFHQPVMQEIHEWSQQRKW